MLSGLKNDELEKIAFAHSIDDLKSTANINQMLRYKLPNDAKFNHHSLGMASGIAAASAPIDTFWLIMAPLELCSLGPAALPLTILVLAIGLGTGISFFADKSESIKKKKTNDLEFLQLADLKSQALDELLSRNKIAPQKSLKKSLEEKKLNPSYKKSVFFGTGMACGFAISHVIGVSSFFQMLGYFSIAGALTGPIGLGICAGLVLAAIGIGAYLGYKHYQAAKTTQYILSQKSFFKKEIKRKHSLYKKTLAAC